jgi:uncharacterized protein YbjT (DUF2867 family)
VAHRVRGSMGKQPPSGGGGVQHSGRRDTRTSTTAKARRVLPGRRWSLASAPATGEKKEAWRRSIAAPFKAVTVRGSSGGGPGLGSRHAAEGMGRGPGSTGGRRWPAVTRYRRARGRAACLTTGQGRDFGTDGWDPGTVPADV